MPYPKVTPIQVNKLREAFNPIWFTDNVYITGDYGVSRPELYWGVHRGVDTRIFNRMFGDDHYAPFKGKVTEIGYYELIGWGITIQSDTKVVDGQECYIRATFLHTKKPTAEKGQMLQKGEVWGKGGIILRNWTAYWRGIHTHTQFIPHYKDEVGNFHPDWGNGFGGAIDPVKFIEGDIGDYEGLDIKTADQPEVYQVINGERYLYLDEVEFSANGRLFTEMKIVSGATMERIPYANQSVGIPNNHVARVVKQITGLAAGDPNRIKSLNKKHYG